MSGRADAGVLLERALVQGAAAAGMTLTIPAADWVRWASVTFVGARHTLTIAAAPSAAFELWLDGLDDRSFALRDHLVADLRIVSRVRDGGAEMVELEVLTVEV